MKKVILTEQANKDTANIDLVPTLELVELLNNEDKKVALAVEKEKKNIAKAIDLITEKVLNGGNLLYFGAGTSGRLGVLDASECPPTFGVTSDLVRGYIAGGDVALRNAIEGAEDNYEQGRIDLINSKASINDIVVGISSSGNPLWLVGVLEEARNNNIATIGITCNPDAKIKDFSDVLICPIVGQEPITGSSRMKAGSAQKMVLNMLSTGMMIKTGKTYGNFMISVQPTNDKLKDRATRIVSEIAEVDYDIAKAMLLKLNYEVSTAILMLKKDIQADEARILLKSQNGILRKLI